MPVKTDAQQSPAQFPNLPLYAAGKLFSFAVQSDGKVIIGGAFTAINGVPRTNLARLNANGSVDATWDPGVTGGGLIDGVNSLLLLGDDLYVGGYFTSIAGQAISNLARLNVSNIEADPQWAPN